MENMDDVKKIIGIYRSGMVGTGTTLAAIAVLGLSLPVSFFVGAAVALGGAIGCVCAD